MIPLPLRTGRLVVRRFAAADAAAFAAYRSQPEVARYQVWDAPYPLERARTAIAEAAHLEGPTAGASIQLACERDGALVGDVFVMLDANGAVADIGYTIDPAHQGHGYAVEATGAVIDALIADGVHRMQASVDPANHASRRVLEHLGFEREGVARRAYRSRAAWVDDERWGMLADDRAGWLARPRRPPAELRLVELGSTPRAYGRLRVHPTQDHLVASVWESFADALFPEADDAGAPLVPWLRGIEADGEPAGFVMCAEPTGTSPVPYLWRLLVDRRHQGRGIGERAVAQVVDRYRAMDRDALLVSWVPGPGSPEPFYLRLGFAPTGEVDDGEVVARLPLRVG